MWANLHLLFWLSLFPFVTGWMGENHFTPLPTALYGSVLLLAALAYYVLQKWIVAELGRDSKLAASLGNDLKRQTFACAISRLDSGGVFASVDFQCHPRVRRHRLADSRPAHRTNRAGSRLNDLACHHLSGWYPPEPTDGNCGRTLREIRHLPHMLGDRQMDLDRPLRFLENRDKLPCKPFFPALRSGPMAVLGATRQKPFPASVSQSFRQGPDPQALVLSTVSFGCLTGRQDHPGSRH